MKRKIVLWGTKNEEKVLLALELLDKEGTVSIYAFPEQIATEDFYNSLMNNWREGQDIEFPEGYTKIERPLSMSDSILPDEIRVERTDVITRAQTEWHFVVLSSKLFEMYRSELEDLQETVEGLKDFDTKVWNEMKAFWSKVQEQVRDKNLFREHASTLKSKTNQLFDQLKEMKKKLDKEFEEESTKQKETFMSKLKEIEEKVEKGLGLKPIFEELKGVQKDFKGRKFTKGDGNKVWNKIDNLFKVVKEKRFGDSPAKSGNNVSRIQNRYDGLLNAISKMERSIKRDKDDQKFQDRKIETTNGQLEMQIRQAKLKMIEERIRSKETKLQDMYKTKVELEQRIQNEKQKAEQEKAKAEAKKAAEAKIAEEVKKSAEKIEESAEKLEEAAAKIAETKKEVQKAKSIPPVELPNEENATTAVEASAPKAEEPKSESIIDKIKDTIEDVMEEAEEVIEDAVDTVKAVAEVIEDEIEKKVDSFKEEEE